MRIEAGAYSRCGTGHGRNEDCALVARQAGRGAELAWESEGDRVTFERHGLLLAVADGIGSYAGGEQASWIVLERLARLHHGAELGAQEISAAAARLEKMLAAVNESLVEYCATRAEIASAGTTIAGAIVFGDGRMIVFHAGDSRVYRASGGLVRQLTADHATSVLESDASERTSGRRHAAGRARVLTNALGPYGLFRPEISVKHSLAPGDRLLITTDGVTGSKGGPLHDGLRERLSRPESALTTAKGLVDATLAADGRDDATAIVVNGITDREDGAALAGGAGA